MMTGCGKASGYQSAQDKLMKMQSYRADTEITYYNKDESVTYRAKQSAASDGRYKIVTYYPENFKDNAILFDGKMIWHYNTNVENKISVNAQDKPERSELILFAFMENYVKSSGKTVATAKTEGAECTVLEADIENAGKGLVSEKLWIDNADSTPRRLVIYDSEGEERISIDYSSFEYNCELAADEFVPQK